MSEIFIRCAPMTEMRVGLAQAVVARCAMYDARIVLIVARGSLLVSGPTGKALERVMIPLEHFARQSREIADKVANGPYCLIDDDHLPIGRTWLDDGLAALYAHPECVMLSSWSINGEVAEGPSHDGVFSVSSCGTPCFVRKGTFVEMPDAPAGQFDGVLSDWLQERGRIGFLRDVRHNHLGAHYSQVVPGHWGA